MAERGVRYRESRISQRSRSARRDGEVKSAGNGHDGRGEIAQAAKRRSAASKRRKPSSGQFGVAAGAEEALQASEQAGVVVRLALPHNETRPAHGLQGTQGGSVASPNRLELSIPVFDASAGSRSPATSFVTVPEAPVNEQDLAPAPKHDVRPARKIARVEAKSITVAMQKAADAQLRASIFAANSRHQCASLRRRQRIGAHRNELNELRTTTCRPPQIVRESLRPPPGKGLDTTAESASETSLSEDCRAGWDCDKRLHTIIVVGEQERIGVPRNTAKLGKACVVTEVKLHTSADSCFGNDKTYNRW